MNVKDYIDKKAKGLAEVVTASGGYAFADETSITDIGALK